MQLVACQLDIVWEDKPANYRRVGEMLAAADVKPGALVALPEMFATGFSMHVDTIAEAEDGPTHAFLSELAGQLKSHVVGGVVTRAPDGRGRNEAVVFAPDGSQVARYSKMHPFSFAGETKYYQAGSAVAGFRCGELSVAPFVCYDLRFPEVFRLAVGGGAQLMVVIANWPAPRAPHWRALLPARAIENQCYVLAVNRAGSDPHIRYAGQSMIVGPRGEIMAQAEEQPQVLSADVELAPLVEYRQEFPALADMRRELLGG